MTDNGVALLETLGMSKRFGGFTAVDKVDFRLMAGARQAIIGPNGAGKTTFINLLTGALEPTEGRVLLQGSDISRVAQAKRVKLGIARTFQIPVNVRMASAGQPRRPKRRASRRGASALMERASGTRPTITICPPTQTVAART